MTLDKLLEARRSMVQVDGPYFMRLPDRWYETHLFRCVNEHVSARILKSEVKGDLCLACGGPVLLTCPEDSDGPMWASVLAEDPPFGVDLQVWAPGLHRAWAARRHNGLGGLWWAYDGRIVVGWESKVTHWRLPAHPGS